MYGIKKYSIIVILILWHAEYMKTEDEMSSTTENLSSLLEGFERSDIPQSDVDDALILEVGVYTTEQFNYMNAQYNRFDDPFNKRWNDYYNICTEDYIKCIISQDNPTPVCGYNKNYPRYADDGVLTFNSYCDLYLDNCRMGYRHWRTINTGECIYTDDYKYMVLSRPENYRRMLKKLYRYLGLHKIRKFLRM